MAVAKTRPRVAKNRGTFALEFMIRARKYHEASKHQHQWFFCMFDGCKENNEFCDRTFSPSLNATQEERIKYAGKKVSRDEVFGEDDCLLRDLGLLR